MATVSPCTVWNMQCHVSENRKDLRNIEVTPARTLYALLLPLHKTTHPRHATLTTFVITLIRSASVRATTMGSPALLCVNVPRPAVMEGSCLGERWMSQKRFSGLFSADEDTQHSRFSSRMTSISHALSPRNQCSIQARKVCGFTRKLQGGV